VFIVYFLHKYENIKEEHRLEKKREKGNGLINAEKYVRRSGRLAGRTNHFSLR
jgi:hypothetical protein